MAEAEPLTDERIRRRRVAAQLLHRPRASSPAEVVRHLLGIQAQDLPGLEARIPGQDRRTHRREGRPRAPAGSVDRPHVGHARNAPPHPDRGPHVARSAHDGAENLQRRTPAPPGGCAGGPGGARFAGHARRTAAAGAAAPRGARGPAARQGHPDTRAGNRPPRLAGGSERHRLLRAGSRRRVCARPYQRLAPRTTPNGPVEPGRRAGSALSAGPRSRSAGRSDLVVGSPRRRRQPRLARHRRPSRGGRDRTRADVVASRLTPGRTGGSRSPAARVRRVPPGLEGPRSHRVGLGLEAHQPRRRLAASRSSRRRRAAGTWPRTIGRRIPMFNRSAGWRPPSNERSPRSGVRSNPSGECPPESGNLDTSVTCTRLQATRMLLTSRAARDGQGA